MFKPLLKYLENHPDDVVLSSIKDEINAPNTPPTIRKFQIHSDIKKDLLRAIYSNFVNNFGSAKIPSLQIRILFRRLDVLESTPPSSSLEARLIMLLHTTKVN